MKSINEAMTLEMNPSHKPAPQQGAGFAVPGVPNETATPGTVRGENPADDEEVGCFSDDGGSSSGGAESSDVTSGTDVGNTDSSADELVGTHDEEPLAVRARFVPAAKRHRR